VSWSSDAEHKCKTAPRTLHSKIRKTKRKYNGGTRAEHKAACVDSHAMLPVARLLLLAPVALELRVNVGQARLAATRRAACSALHGQTASEEEGRLRQRWNDTGKWTHVLLVPIPQTAPRNTPYVGLLQVST
jgi:hypothetical protein